MSAVDFLDRAMDRLDRVAEKLGRAKALETVLDGMRRWQGEATSRIRELENENERAREQLFELVAGQRANRPVIPTPDLLDLVDEVSDALTSRRRHAPPRPQWENVKPAVEMISRIVKSDPMYVGRVDRLQARLRDQYDDLGVSITDEDSLYVVLVTVGMIVEIASSGIRAGTLVAEDVGRIAAVAQTMTAALIDYLPADAKP